MCVPQCHNGHHQNSHLEAQAQGGHEPVTDRTNHMDSKFFASMEKLVCEKVNLFFSKFILGVHKKAQTSTIRGDLG